MYKIMVEPIMNDVSPCSQNKPKTSFIEKKSACATNGGIDRP